MPDQPAPKRVHVITPSSSTQGPKSKKSKEEMKSADGAPGIPELKDNMTKVKGLKPRPKPRKK